MNKSPAKKPHIVFLYSDTGGGHRSAAEAIIEALELEYPDKFTCEMVDFFLNYSPPPLNLAGPVYPIVLQEWTRFGNSLSTAAMILTACASSIPCSGLISGSSFISCFGNTPATCSSRCIR